MSSYVDFVPRRRIDDRLALSPDGTEVAYIEDSSGQPNLVVQGILGGSPRQLTRYTDSAVRTVFWHPDGGSLVFLADTKGMENMQVYRVDRDGGEPVALTTAPAATHQVTSPGQPFSADGRYLAYCGNDRAAGDQDVLVVELATGRNHRAYDGGGNVWNGEWSPDGRWLTVAEHRGGNSDHVVYLVPGAGGPARRLTPLAGSDTYWLGPWLADGSGFLVRTTAGRQFHALAVMSPADGSLSWLDTPDWDVEEVVLSADGRVLVWMVNVDGAAQLRARDLTTGADLPVPALPWAGAAGMVISADGRWVALTLSTPTRPQNIAVVDLVDGGWHWVTDAAPVAARPEVLAQPELVRYPARDGQAIPAYLYRPDTTDPAGVVMAIHGGPSWQERPTYGGDGLFQYLRSQGVAVWVPNIRGSTGYGTDYQNVQHRDWGGIDLADLDDGVRYLVAQPWVDPDRLGLFGRSYGGFAVLSCITRLAGYHWAAAVCWCGPSNLVTLARAAPPTWRSKVGIMIGDYEQDAEFLTARSPVTHVDQVRAPLFVLQGANDPRVPQDESDQIVQRLRARGVEVRYDVYPDEGHQFTRRENQTRARGDAAEFLLAHLLRR